MPLCDKSLDKRKSVFTSLPVKQIIVIFSTNETVAEYECLYEINLIVEVYAQSKHCKSS